MPIFYKGAPVGTHWHSHDAKRTGFRSRRQVANADRSNTQRLMEHIARGTTTSPFISLTRSYEVALTYAQIWQRPPEIGESGFIYEIEIVEGGGVELIDPVKAVSAILPEPFDVAYQHDGPPDFLIGVVAPARFSEYWERDYAQPTGNHGTRRPPQLSIQLETLVRALRDAEILAVGQIPASCVMRRWPIR